ncbi:MAG: OPT/YSL family transporter [Planctomycetota bacterium]|jgi:putative OPT family oligopeptide transporter|nr:OPT/YSL family transporter [Planctomycetota bacterium]MDP6838686.1 OPT/YSL family transporter [Planctomycetota bacterium]
MYSEHPEHSDRLSLLFGVLISALLSGTLVIAGLKAGITPGVSPLVILVAWGAFSARASGARGRRFLNIAQVAGSGGMSVTAGVIFTAPLLQILYTSRGLEAPAVDIPTLMLLSVAGSLLGIGFVGLATRKFLSDPSLPAPEARACETMIEAAAARPEDRPRLGRSLVLGLLASFLAPLVAKLGLVHEHIVLFARKNADRAFSLEMPFNPIYLGIGGLLTLPTALLVFSGSALRLMGDWGLAGVAAGSANASAWPDNSMRWVGGGAMTVAVAWSLIKFRGAGKLAAAQKADSAGVLTVDPFVRRWLKVSIVAGTLLIFGWIVAVDGLGAFSFAMGGSVLIMATLMVTLGAILSLQIGSSASPVSGTIFVTTLVLCLVALALGRHTVDDVALLTPLLVGACVAVCAANDSSQDYKTLQLCGVRVQDGFLAQLLGTLAGCLVVPVVVYVAHEAYTLGSPELIAPQGQMFATLVEGLLLESRLPWAPIQVGLLVGLGAVAMEVLGAKRGLMLPSMALAVGIYLPAFIGLGILVGAGARRLAEGPSKAGQGATHESILTSAGMITGAAAFELLLGLGILFGFRQEALELFHPSGLTADLLAWLGISALALILFINSRRAQTQH